MIIDNGRLRICKLRSVIEHLSLYLYEDRYHVVETGDAVDVVAPLDVPLDLAAVLKDLFPDVELISGKESSSSKSSKFHSYLRQEISKDREAQSYHCYGKILEHDHFVSLLMNHSLPVHFFCQFCRYSRIHISPRSSPAGVITN